MTIEQSMMGLEEAIHKNLSLIDSLREQRNELLRALIELEREADLALDFRTKFQLAIANAHAAIAKVVEGGVQ